MIDLGLAQKKMGAVYLFGGSVSFFSLHFSMFSSFLSYSSDSVIISAAYFLSNTHTILFMSVSNTSRDIGAFIRVKARVICCRSFGIGYMSGCGGCLLLHVKNPCATWDFHSGNFRLEVQ